MTEGKDNFLPSLEESIPVEVFKSEVRAWAERIDVKLQKNSAADEAQ